MWRATHLALDRPVALKLVEFSGHELERYARRFLREARVAASIRHRYVVEILDFGTTDEGLPYIVMEHLEGESLGDRLYGRGAPLPMMLGWFEQLLTGLAAVHDRGVVHRDLKPDNVFLVADPEGEFPKLLDFGISRVTRRDDDEQRVGPKTHEARLVGTPWYMSPEQVRGRRDVDHRTDLYAVGAMLYEALSGQLPFEADDLRDLVVKVATAKPTPIEALCPELPEALLGVVRRAMAHDRHARYDDAEHMREALRAAATPCWRCSTSSPIPGSCGTGPHCPHDERRPASEVEGPASGAPRSASVTTLITAPGRQQTTSITSDRVQARGSGPTGPRRAASHGSGRSCPGASAGDSAPCRTATILG